MSDTRKLGLVLWVLLVTGVLTGAAAGALIVWGVVRLLS